MPGSYHAFTSARTTEPDQATFLAQLKALDVTAGVQHMVGEPTYVIKKATAWTGPQIAAAQSALDSAPAASERLAAQAIVDAIPLYEKAIILALIDEINLIRSLLPVPLGPRTVQQALSAIRAKAGTL